MRGKTQEDRDLSRCSIPWPRASATRLFACA
ncbi:hypothetical protein CC_0046 [Caulobacter vibrioides CB15]|uniref:Uncharacterized protein n=1 Tax=Caulobacter vibrioides (strain ATCC 19089 / CIP 103742 / CB 15) TaxID=190650 RepID=Q9AC21_CAUVC|nr:hypothetical protein CC_0046 [Caulobacter vibrioides CB15]